MGKSSDTTEIHFDGMCEPNPGGITTYGFVIYRRGKKEVAEGGKAAESGTPEATNNVAEYMGLLKGLERAVEKGYWTDPVEVFGDSKLVIMQISGNWRVRDRKLAPLYLMARELADRFPSARFTWVPRERNREADQQTYVAYVRELAGERGA